MASYMGIRTWIGDPAFHNNLSHIQEIPTKEYSDQIFSGITDVRDMGLPSVFAINLCLEL